MYIINRNIFLYLVLILGIFAGITACSSSTSDDGKDPYVVINDDSELEKRYTERDSIVDIDSTDSNGYKSKFKQKRAKFSLTLVAELSTPSVGTEGIQATMVSTDGNSATVSYNKKGSSYRGSLDVLQVTSSNAKSMRIRSSVEFFDADVNAVFATGNRVWGALATENSQFTTGSDRSALQGFRMQGFDLETTDDLTASLPSFAANSVIEFNNQVFVTSGSEGGLSVYNESLTEQLNFTELNDARWVDVNDEYLVVLLGDANGDGEGELVVMDPDSYGIQNRYDFPGADIPEAKNTVELINHLAFIAAGNEGVQVMDLTSGNIVAEIPRPDPSDLGLSSEKVMTNAVSVDEDKIFISNGEAGQNVDRYSPGENVELTMLGKLSFGDLESVNHVAYRSKMLVVAAGAGGVKIVRLDAK